MNNMNKNNGADRQSRHSAYPNRSSSWPNLGENPPLNSSFHQALLQMLHTRQNIYNRNQLTNDENESERNSAQSNGTTSAPRPTARLSSLFESSNPFLPEMRRDEPWSTDGNGAFGQPPHRSSSLPSILQRSSWLAVLMQEAIDISSTIVFADDVLDTDTDDDGNEDEDEDADISDVHDQ